MEQKLDQKRVQVDLDMGDVKIHLDLNSGGVKIHFRGVPWAPPGPPLGLPLGSPEPPLGLSWRSFVFPLAPLRPSWALLGPPLCSLWTPWAPLGLFSWILTWAVSGSTWILVDLDMGGVKIRVEGGLQGGSCLHTPHTRHGSIGLGYVPTHTVLGDRYLFYLYSLILSLVDTRSAC